MAIPPRLAPPAWGRAPEPEIKLSLAYMQNKLAAVHHGASKQGQTLGVVRDVGALLAQAEAARTHRIDKHLVLSQTQRVVGELWRAKETLVDPVQRGHIATLAAHLITFVAQTVEPEKGTLPSPQAAAQLATVATAASLGGPLATVPAHHVVSTGNAMLGSVLHTGDEIWAASAACIRTAKKSVQLQTWAYHRRSESARHIMGALADLQQQQALRRDRGEAVEPIAVDIIRGSASWGTGSDQKTGGNHEATLMGHDGEKLEAKSMWHHEIFPFAVDPALLRVTFSEHKHRFRGAEHSKTLLVDGEIGVVTSANVKGSHHRATTLDAPFHDFGIILAGDVVRGAMQDDFLAAQKQSKLIASNSSAPSLSLAHIQRTTADASAERSVAPLRPHIQRVSDDKVASITAAVAHWRTDPRGTASMVAIAKAPYDGLYGKAPASPQRQAFLAAIDSAKSVIEINNTNFNADDVIASLKRAMDRGVDVRIVTSKKYNDTIYAHKLGTNSNREVFQDLIAYRVKNKSPGGLHLKWHANKQGEDQYFKSSHTKVMFVDQQLAIFGSANLDAQSWSYSGEFNLATDDPHTVHQLRASLFDDFWAEGQIKINIPNSQRDSAAQNRMYGALAPSTAASEENVAFSSTASATLTDGSRASTFASIDATSSVKSSFDANVPQVAAAVPWPEQNVSTDARQSSRANAFENWQSRLFDQSKLNAHFKEVLAGTDLVAKADFLQRFNRELAPRLKVEEAAIERLVMKHDRLKVPEGTPFAFNIQSNIFNDTVDDYAPRYQRVDTFVSAKTGTRANLYLPSQDSPAGIPYRAILAYQGLTFRPDGLLKGNDKFIGLRSAFDRKGVGHRAFSEDGEALLSWSRNLLSAGTPLTIAGFSKGGTLAARHFAAHSAEERSQIRLLTYAAPALDRQTARQMAQGWQPVDARHFRSRQDLVPRAGEQHPPGEIFKLAPRINFPSWRNHTYPTMSTLQLQGRPVQKFQPTKPATQQRSRAIEWARRLISRFPLPR